MPKSHDRPHREAKKPKANKKAAPAGLDVPKAAAEPGGPVKPKEPTKEVFLGLPGVSPHLGPPRQLLQQGEGSLLHLLPLREEAGRRARAS